MSITTNDITVDLNDHSGLRGIAAIWIMVFHYILYSKYSLDLEGSSIMPLFFILSGFALTIAYDKRFNDLNNEFSINNNDLEHLKGGSTELEVSNTNRLIIIQSQYSSTFKFYYNRIIRTIPVYYITMAIAAGLVPTGFWFVNPNDQLTIYKSIITNVLPVNTWFCFLLGIPFDGPSWTICTLIAFWISFPYGLKYFQTKSDKQLLETITIYFWFQLIVMFLIFIPLIILSHDFTFSFDVATFHPLSRFPVFYMGVCAGLLCNRFPNGDLPYFTGAGSFLYVGSFCKNVNYIYNKSHDWPSIAYYSSLFCLLLTLGAFVLDTISRLTGGGDILGCLWLQAIIPMMQLDVIVSISNAKGQSIVSTVLRSPIMISLGDISMCLYLIHLPVLYYFCFILHGSYLQWPDTFDCSQYDSISQQSQYDECSNEVSEFNDARLIPEWSIVPLAVISIMIAYALYYFVELPVNSKYKI